MINSKSITFLFFGLLCFVLPLSAQESRSLKFDDLVAPESPGFQILGIAPQSIYRPTDTKALGAYFLNQLDSPSGLADNFAVELTPYWLSKDSTLSFRDYFGFSGNNAGIDIADNIKKTFVLSVASSSFQSQTDSDQGRSWGFGFRSTLIRGKPRIGKRIQLVSDMTNASIITEAYAEVVQEIEKGRIVNREETIRAIEIAFDQYIENPDLIEGVSTDRIISIKTSTMDFIMSNLPHSIEEITSFVNKQEDEAMNDIAESIRDESIRYTGLRVQLAGALSIDIPTNGFRNTQGNNYGLWLTVSHEINNKGDLHATGLIRYLGSFQNLGGTNKDLGISLSKESDLYAFSGELIYRSFEEKYLTQDINSQEITALNEDNTWRFTTNFQLKISGDANLMASIGKDFDSEITADSNLIALLGINFDLFRSKSLTF